MRSRERSRRFGYDWWVNAFASILLMLFWKLVAWALATRAPHWLGLGLTEDHWFMTMVAMYVALGIRTRDWNAS